MGVPREKLLTVRLTESEHKLLEGVAGEKALPTSSWARSTLIGASKASSGSPDLPMRGSDLGLVSFFCGPGGLDEGFRQAGFETILATDRDADCVRTFRHNHPQARVEEWDITETTVAQVFGALPQGVQPVGVIGGPPCQSFSVSNVHQSDVDPRHCLPEHYARLLKEMNETSPLSFFVFENVLGLLGAKHRVRYEVFKRLFEEAGFEIYEEHLDAKNFGVAQERPRVFIIGINRDLHSKAKWIPPREEDRALVVRDLIGDLDSVEPVQNGSGLDPKTFPLHPNHWCLVPRSDKFKSGRLKPGKPKGRCFRVLDWDRPSWTVAYGNREVHVHPRGHRRLSIFEAMRLQSFPDHYQLVGNMTAQVRLVSEAVAPRMAFHLAYAIRRSLGL